MKKGFTLIELMIVVAIIAIIAAIAIPSLLRSRMAANQTAAAAACKAFAEAEEIFHRTDYDKDGILEYSTSLSGANSTLMADSLGTFIELVDRTFGMAEGAPGSVPPRAGYVFRVLTQQGTSATGGSRNYITTNPTAAGFVAGTSMTLGYAISAAPGAYDSTGRDSYIINGNGTIYQFDKGLTASTSHETQFNPTVGSWLPTE